MICGQKILRKKAKGKEKTVKTKSVPRNCWINTNLFGIFPLSHHYLSISILASALWRLTFCPSSCIYFCITKASFHASNTFIQIQARFYHEKIKRTNCEMNRLNEPDDVLSRSTVTPGHLILSHHDYLLFDWPCDTTHIS